MPILLAAELRIDVIIGPVANLEMSLIVEHEAVTTKKPQCFHTGVSDVVVALLSKRKLKPGASFLADRFTTTSHQTETCET